MLAAFTCLILTLSVDALAGSDLTWDAAAASIRTHLASENARRASQYRSCTLSAHEDCAISRMPADETTVVLPGGGTRCISTKNPYGFQVIPGHIDKLLFYFQGGGACWDSTSTSAQMCTQDAHPMGLAGVLSRTDSKNPFRAHTVVVALYCSGDAFVSNNMTQPWRTNDGGWATQTGQQNVLATIDWATQNLLGQHGALSSLVVMGCSAGSLGGQAWTAALFDRFPAREQAAVYDSYLGIFPQGVQGSVLRDTWPMCDSMLGKMLSHALLAKCHAGELTLQEWMGESVRAHPTKAHTWIQSKTDAVQLSFYAAIAVSFGKLPISALTEYERANEIFLGYDGAPNAIHYLISSEMHCYTPDVLFYTADTAGLKGGGATVGVPSLLDWTASIAAQRRVTTECDGKLVTEREWKAQSQPTYCSSEMANKSFIPTLTSAVTSAVPLLEPVLGLTTSRNHTNCSSYMDCCFFTIPALCNASMPCQCEEDGGACFTSSCSIGGCCRPRASEWNPT